MRSLVFILLYLVTFGLKAQSIDTVSFFSDTLRLYGNLYIPSGPGPFPGVVLIHGSGPNDRFQTLPLNGGNAQCLYPGLYPATVRNFKDLAEGLQDSGIAVLTYDKRTFTYSTRLDITTLVIEDFIADGSAAVNYLSQRGEINTDRIIVAGHSQGATLAPYIRLQNNEVDGLISLAGPAQPIDSLLPDQIRYIYDRCADSLQGEQIAAQLYQAFQMVRANTWPANQALSGAYAPFWRSWFFKTDSVIEAFQNAAVPHLFIQGADDFNVPLENVKRFERALNLATRDLGIYDSLNHYLTLPDEPSVRQSLIDQVVRWIKSESAIHTREQPVAQPYTYYQNGEYLYVRSLREDQSVELELYDIKGHLVNRSSSRGLIRVHLPQQGLYIGRVYAENQHHTIKVLR